ncbi:MAG: beta-propeller domain-containing protein, partial [Candidatus Thermoplasmatota archaeon]
MEKQKLKMFVLIVGIIFILTFSYPMEMKSFVRGEDEHLSSDFRNFDSYKQFISFLNNCSNSKGNMFYEDRGVYLDESVVSGSLKNDVSSVDYSDTNIQVEGVDEPDVVKTDGKHIYLVSEDNVVYLLEAWPAEEARILSEIDFNYSVKNIFVKDNVLVVFGQDYKSHMLEKQNKIVAEDWYSGSNTFIRIYDIENRSEPVMKREVISGGIYSHARLIENHIYVITTLYPYHITSTFEENKTVIPQISVDGKTKNISLSNIYCLDKPYSSYTLTHIVSIDLTSEEEGVEDKVFTLEDNHKLYVSNDNIYLAVRMDQLNFNNFQKAIDEIVIDEVSETVEEDIEKIRSLKFLEENQKTRVIRWTLQNY